MKKILVPTDFSAEAEHALDLAVQIAKKTKATIQLFHVVENYASVSFNLSAAIGAREPIQQSAEQEAFVALMLKRATELLKIKVKEHKGVKIEPFVQVGGFFSTISDKISQKGLDLIVMGTHGVSNLDEEYVGSNTYKVIRHAKCPVISVKKALDLGKMKRIAFALSFEEDNEKVLKAAVAFQELSKAKLHLVRINHLGSVMSDRKVQELGEKLAKKHDIRNYEISTYADEDLEAGILHFAEDQRCDMIMMATHSRSGFIRVLSRKGSVAEDIATHTQLPVWTYTLKK
jgi:nucleotide-binding universal stress UspA family protein